MKKDILLNALQNDPVFLAGVKKTEREIQAIGTVLFFLTNAESAMDRCLAVWMTGDHNDPQFGKIEGFISKVPFRTKTTLAEQIGLLDKQSASTFHRLYDLRNTFAHTVKKGDLENISNTVMTEIEPILNNIQNNIEKLLSKRRQEKILRLVESFKALNKKSD